MNRRLHWRHVKQHDRMLVLKLYANGYQIQLGKHLWYASWYKQPNL